MSFWMRLRRRSDADEVAGAMEAGFGGSESEEKDGGT